jgi:hypothetical protein
MMRGVYGAVLAINSAVEEYLLFPKIPGLNKKIAQLYFGV